MKVGFSETAAPFKSASQSARIDTEAWAASHMFCPNCGHIRLEPFPANRPVADFFCNECGDEYELKSKKRKFGRKVVDGAYESKIERLSSNTSPNLILLHYDRSVKEVRSLTVVPRFFFTSAIIERRKPLAEGARRAGWVGSNILLDRIPNAGRIPIIEDGIVLDRVSILDAWKRLRFLEKKPLYARGWLLEVMHCIEHIGSQEFSISEIYSFENRLSATYPNNKNVRPKIRQQLQELRDAGYLAFLGGGRYRVL